MKVQTYINEGPGMFWGYEPGDKLVPGPTVEIDEGTAAGESQRELMIAEVVWIVGNRMGKDHAGRAWPSTVRSLSVSDVVVIGETAYCAASVGWDRIESDALAWSLDPERQVHNTRLEESRR